MIPQGNKTPPHMESQGLAATLPPGLLLPCLSKQYFIYISSGGKINFVILFAVSINGMVNVAG
jgi:hypothetical protein